MQAVWQCIIAIILHTSTKMDENESYFVAQVKKLFYGLQMQMRYLYGKNLEMRPVKQELIAVYLETRAKKDRQSLSSRLAPLLISAGLVKGNTPMLIRKQLGAKILATALWPLDGGNVVSPKKD